MRTAGFLMGHAGNRALLSLDVPSQELCQGEQYFKRFRHLTQLFKKSYKSFNKIHYKLQFPGEQAPVYKMGDRLGGAGEAPTGTSFPTGKKKEGQKGSDRHLLGGKKTNPLRVVQ